jgi:hypothetical protein
MKMSIPDDILHKTRANSFKRLSRNQPGHKKKTRELQANAEYEHRKLVPEDPRDLRCRSSVQNKTRQRSTNIVSLCLKTLAAVEV